MGSVGLQNHRDSFGPLLNGDVVPVRADAGTFVVIDQAPCSRAKVEHAGTG
jgi:hypothetical protein